MTTELKVSDAVANAQADLIGQRCRNGWLRLYGGTKPASADDPVGPSALATLRFAQEAFRPAADRQIASNPIAPDLNTEGAGEATWFRAFMEDGTTPVFDGTVGVSGCNINLAPSAMVHAGGEVHIGSIIFRVSN